MYEVPNTFVPGNLIKSAEVNENFTSVFDTLNIRFADDILDLYTGTDLNIALLTSDSTSVSNTRTVNITAQEIADNEITHIKVFFVGGVNLGTTNVNYRKPFTYNLYINETGEADALVQTTTRTVSFSEDSIHDTLVMPYIHELTNDEITGGVTIKFNTYVPVSSKNYSFMYFTLFQSVVSRISRTTSI